MARRFAAILPLVSAAIPLLAQQPTSGGIVQERATATVVEIPVNVIGKDGRPVAGLRKEDFELYDDGKKQPISALEVVDLSRRAGTEATAAAAADAIPASARRLWLLVFDLSYTSPSGLLRARDGARDFVTRGMSDNDLAAVATLSMETGWQLLLNFTHDRRQAAAAVDTLGLPSIATRSADPLAFAYTSPTVDASPSGAQPMTRSPREADLLESLRDIRTLQRQSTDELARGRVLKLFNSLAGIGRLLDSVRGRKHVLFFSEGFETRLLSGRLAGGGRDASLQQGLAGSSLDSSTPQGAGEAALSGEIWKVDSDARFGSSSLRDVLVASLSMFRRSDAVLDTIDISGLRADGEVSGPKPGSGTDALFTMASETDGDFVRNANQLGGELAKVADRTNLVYLLVYQPKPSGVAPGTFHKLKVEVKAPAAKILARSGYAEPRPYAALSPLERLLASGDLLTGGDREQALRARVLVAPFAARGEVAQVPIVLEIPGADLLSGGATGKAAVQIYAYANEASGALADYTATEMTVDLTTLKSQLESGGVKFYATFYLPPGSYAVRALVRNAASGRSGVVAGKVSVPKIPGGAPTVLPPLFSEPEGKWAMVRANPRSDAPQRTFEYPFTVAGESFVPAALPQVENGAAARVTVVTYNFGGDAKKAPLQVRAEVVGPDGTARPAKVDIVKESDRERAEARKVLLSFTAEGLAPGRYALKVSVTEPVGKVTGEGASVFEVR